MPLLVRVDSRARIVMLKHRLAHAWPKCGQRVTCVPFVYGAAWSGSMMPIGMARDARIHKTYLACSSFATPFDHSSAWHWRVRTYAGDKVVNDSNSMEGTSVVYGRCLGCILR